MSRIPINIAELVGDTPLVGLPQLLRGTGRGRRRGAVRQARVPQPGRVGQGQDRRGDDRGRRGARAAIEPGRTTIVEATTGNTGIALAFVCAAKGYELVLTLPQGMSRERESLLRLYGARVNITESLGGMGEAVAAARAMAERARRVPARPVLQSRQSGGPSPHDRPGDRARAGWARRRARRRRRHRRARSPASADTCVSAIPTCASSRWSRSGSAVLSGALPGPHRIQGIGAGFVPAVLEPRAARRGDPRLRRRRDPHRLGLRAARGRARRASPAAPRCGPRCRSPRARSPRAGGSS